MLYDGITIFFNINCKMSVKNDAKTNDFWNFIYYVVFVSV